MTSQATKDLSVELCGLELRTPIVLLSGCVGFGEEYTRVDKFSNLDTGAVCLKGTTLQARLGNDSHRVTETPSGMINAIGLQNPGADIVVKEILPSLDFESTKYIANISGSTLEEYEAVASIFNDSLIDAIEINISCPNVKEGGIAFGNDLNMSASVVEICRSVTTKPLITKLSPNQTNIAESARVCIEAGSDALSVSNTFTAMAIDVESRRPVLNNNIGGLSGPAIKPMALLRVHEVYQVSKIHGIPIIGQGGITSWSDAIEFLIAGASAVGVGTGLFYDPCLCSDINLGISSYMVRHNFEKVSEITGSLKINE
mgnify:FL=1|tara:strand:+ start:64 stop:1008 length:945 start_codon:yes stop_codon:yes gene_type:complete